MTDTYISFYLRNNRIHIFVEALRGIGSPPFFCFLLNKDGESLIIAPYNKKDFHSHRVSLSVYNGQTSLELTSKRLCQMLSANLHWDSSMSYRAPGKIIEQQKIVVFDLRQATGFKKAHPILE